MISFALVARNTQSFGCKGEVELGDEDFHYSNTCCFMN
jgi:hypothetical protein